MRRAGLRLRPHPGRAGPRIVGPTSRSATWRCRSRRRPAGQRLPGVRRPRRAGGRRRRRRLRRLLHRVEPHLDKGVDGVEATLDTFDSGRLRPHRQRPQRPGGGTPTDYTVKGVRIAHLVLHVRLQRLPLPAEAPWAANLIDPARILADAARPGRPVPSSSWSACTGAPRTCRPRRRPAGRWPRSYCRPQDIDLVIGHHAHVVQPIEGRRQPGRVRARQRAVEPVRAEQARRSDRGRRGHPLVRPLAVHRPRDRPDLGRPRGPPGAARRAHPRRPGHASRPRRRPPQLLRPDGCERHLRRRPGLRVPPIPG